MEGTIKSPANYVALTPISFLDRSAVVYADRISVVYGSLRYTWRQTRDRCVRIASALSQLGISTGDVVRTFFSFRFFLYLISLFGDWSHQSIDIFGFGFESCLKLERKFPKLIEFCFFLTSIRFQCWHQTFQLWLNCILVFLWLELCYVH